MLKAAGHPDGITFTITVPDTQADTEDVAVRNQSYAKAAGFTVKIDKLASAPFATESSTGQWDSTLVDKVASNASQAAQLATLYRDAPYNWSKWVNPTFLNMVDATLKNPDQNSDAVREGLHEAELYLIAAQPSIWITRPQPTIVYAKNITGVVQRLDPYMNLATMKFSN